jgi:hypothetical protein
MTACRLRRSSCAAAGGDRPLDAAAASGAGDFTTCYTEASAERVLQKLLTGRSLRDVCGDPGMPRESTVRNWVADNREGFAARYRQARKVGDKAVADRKLELIDWILDELASGRTLRDVCRNHGMPAHNTALAWMAEHRARYEEARQYGYEVMIDEILEIADDARCDWKRNKAGELVRDRENIARAELRVNARRWLLSKASPKTWGNGGRS